MNWTASQSEAISSRNHCVLVSAAAGSGKTAVLLERVTNLLLEGYDLSEMLIVTFTRAAASELKAKLMKKLDESDNDLLRRQALYVNRADICTIHVFCSRLIREYFQESGIDPLSGIADTYVLDDELDKARADVLEEAYDHPTEDENILFTSYTTAQILVMLSSLRKFLNARADGDSWTENALNSNSIDVFVEEMRKNALLLPDLAMGFLNECDKILDLPNAPVHYEETLKADIELTKTIASQLESGEYQGGEIIFAERSRKRNIEYDHDLADKYKKVRDAFKETLNKISSCFPEDRAAAQADIDFTLPSLRAIVSLNKRAEERYTREKRRRNQLDYGDLEHLALKTLKNDAIRKEIHLRYRAVFVDEYQDVSALQEALISRITGPETLLFMVGDVKQSIYRFRQADPTLFREKYETYSDDKAAPERRIILQQNFRSTRNILSCVNTVFAHAMRRDATELDYDEKAMLYPSPEAEKGEACEFMIIKGAADEDSEDYEKVTKGYEHEAVCIAARISDLIRNGLVNDNGEKVPVTYKDIVILVRNVSGRAAYIAKILTDRGIPVFSDASEQFFDLPEVSDILSVLQVLLNPYQDIPLIAALHSPCFGFTEKELALLKLTNLKSKMPWHRIFFDAAGQDSILGKKVRECIETLDRWRFLGSQMTVSSLIRMIMDETGLYTRAGTLHDGELRQANMRLLCDRADGLADPYDLGEFLRLVNIARNSDEKTSAKSIGENENVVRIMTIHKSKGLEFPVVFVMETARKFKNDTELLQTDPQTGMALAYIDGDLRIKKDTYASKCLKMQREQHARAEECRLLYVAMTRAQRKLILVCSLDNAVKHTAIWSRQRKSYTAGNANRMSDWIGQALQEAIEIDHDRLFTDRFGGEWKIIWKDAENVQSAVTVKDTAGPREEDRVGEDIIYWMNRKPLVGDVLKTSVTAVSKKLRSEDDMEETAAKKRRPENKAICPAFLEPEKDMTPAEKGTLMHKVLGCIDYESVREGHIDAALMSLVGREILTKKEYDCIQSENICKFFDSEIGKGALASKTVHREWPFVLKLENFTILQGVIDLCYLENGNWILVDYKTDRVDEEELIKRYRLQINWYRVALEKITNISVSRICLYSLFLNREIPLPVFDPDKGTDRG